MKIYLKIIFPFFLYISYLFNGNCLQAQGAGDKEVEAVLKQIDVVLKKIGQSRAKKDINGGDIAVLKNTLQTLIESKRITDLELLGVLKSFKERNDTNYIKLTSQNFSNAVNITTYLNNVLIYQNDILNIKHILLTEKFKDSVEQKIVNLIDVIKKLPDTTYVKTIRASVDSTLQLVRNHITEIEVSKKDTEVLRNYTKYLLADSIVRRINIISMKIQSENDRDSVNQTFINYMGAGGFNNSIFSLFYYRCFKSNAGKINWIIGPEIILPINSKTTNHAGFFGSSGLQQGRVLLQMGVGWLKTGSENDVSWKCGIAYFPLKFGIGASYSPLIGFGSNFVFRFQ